MQSTVIRIANFGNKISRKDAIKKLDKVFGLPEMGIKHVTKQFESQNVFVELKNITDIEKAVQVLKEHRPSWNVTAITNEDFKMLKKRSREDDDAEYNASKKQKEYIAPITEIVTPLAQYVIVIWFSTISLEYAKQLERKEKESKDLMLQFLRTLKQSWPHEATLPSYLTSYELVLFSDCNI